MLISRNWWAILIRGIAAVVFGILAILWPGVTFVVLTLLFGAYALVDGIFAITAVIRKRGPETPIGWLLFEGIFGILAGIVAFFFTGIAALALLYVASAWAIITGVLEVMQAIELRRVIANEWLLILGGIVSVIFGLLLLLFPGAGMLAVSILIGIYAIVFGVLLIGLSLRLRSRWEQDDDLGTLGRSPATGAT